MSVGNAKMFISRGLLDSSLRNELNCAASIENLDLALANLGLRFSSSDFDEAYNHEVLQCQFEDQSDRLAEFRMWWELLILILGGENSIESTTTRPPCSMREPCPTCNCQLLAH